MACDEVRDARDGVKATFAGTSDGTSTIEWPEASEECVRVFGDGPVTVDNCAFGRRNEPHNRYRIRVQGRSSNVRSQFSFNSLVSHNSNEPVFTAHCLPRGDTGTAGTTRRRRHYARTGSSRR